MQCPPESTGAVGFFHNVNNIKFQFRKCENGFDGNLKTFTFLRAVVHLNAEKVMFSHSDSFREFSSVREFCTDINIISDLSGLLLDSVEPCGSNHCADRNAYWLF